MRKRVSDDIEDRSGPSVEMSSHDDRGGVFFPANRELYELNDDSHSNPLRGRCVSDKRQLNTRRKMLRIGIWNIRTLFKSGKYDNIKHEMKEMNHDILGVAEIWWTNDGRIINDGYNFIYSGVGFMLQNYVAESLIGFWSVSDRLIKIQLSGKPCNINLIQVYAPTSSHNNEEHEELYESIDYVMGHTKSGEIVIIMGDWNAKVGYQYKYPITRKYGLGKRNVYGEN